MGADFLYVLAPIWKATDERKAKLKQVIAEITDEAIVEYNDLGGFFGVCDEENEDNPLGLTPQEIFKEAREMIFDACMACEEASFSTRETSILKLADMNWQAVITGGMSWGENPTDAFESILIVVTIEEVFELLKAWSVEDCGGDKENNKGEWK